MTSDYQRSRLLFSWTKSAIYKKTPNLMHENTVLFGFVPI